MAAANFVEYEAVRSKAFLADHGHSLLASVANAPPKLGPVEEAAERQFWRFASVPVGRVLRPVATHLHQRPRGMSPGDIMVLNRGLMNNINSLPRDARPQTRASNERNYYPVNHIY